MTVEDFKLIIVEVKTLNELKSLIVDGYQRTKKQLEDLGTTFFTEENEDQWDHPPHHINSNLIKEYQVYADLWRRVVKERVIGLEKQHEDMIKPYRELIEKKMNELRM